MKFSYMFLMTVIPCLLIGCKSHPNSSAQKEIIGSNDFVSVDALGTNIPENLRPLIDAVGLLRPNGCTVTHIGNGYAVTAGHCFTENGVTLHGESCAGFSVVWSYRVGHPPTGQSECVKIIRSEYFVGEEAYGAREVDFALIQLSSAPVAAIQLASGPKPESGKNVTILSHPRSRPLEWSKNCEMSPQPSSVNFDSSQRFSHLCDTEKASSGAVVIDKELGKIVGIHTQGSTRANFGTYISGLSLEGQISDRQVPQPGPVTVPGFTEGNQQPQRDRPVPPPVPVNDPDVPTAQPVIRADPIQFGPFSNNEDRLLVEFAAERGKYVTFQTDIDLEKWQDYLEIKDAHGRQFALTGQRYDSFTLKTPVMLRITSNSSTESQEVKVRGIVFHPKWQVPE
jgi:V8-like Glu-specific endopeptidase